jgi:hypothetical protein
MLIPGQKGKALLLTIPVDAGWPSNQLRAEDRRPGGGADLQELLRKHAVASESGEIPKTCANRIGMLLTF